MDVSIYKFDTDMDELFSGPGTLEIPVSGPGRANTLVIISGICNSGKIDESTTQTSIDVDVLDSEIVRPTGYIFTNYSLGPQDEYLDIVDENKEPKYAAFIALTGIAADDDTDVVFAFDRVWPPKIGQGGRVIVRFDLGLNGDVTITRFSYHICLLIRKPLPPPPGPDSPLLKIGPLHDPLRFER